MVESIRRPNSGQAYASSHNRVRRIGHVGKHGFTMVPNDLIREGIGEVGLNAFAVMAFLLSQSDGWETSAVDMARRFGWGTNRQRVREALASLEKAGWLVIRDHFWDDATDDKLKRGRGIRQEYVIRADGQRFSDAERAEWSRPQFVARQPVATPGEPSC